MLEDYMNRKERTYTFKHKYTRQKIRAKNKRKAAEELGCTMKELIKVSSNINS